MHGVIAAIQEVLGVKEGDYAAHYFDDMRWRKLSDALACNDAVSVMHILVAYADAERRRLES